MFFQREAIFEQVYGWILLGYVPISGSLDNFVGKEEEDRALSNPRSIGRFLGHC